MQHKVEILTEVIEASPEIKAFEASGWYKSDLEHYGRAMNFTKNRYKFVIKTPENRVKGILDLMTEANVGFIEGILVGEEYRRQGVGSALLKKCEELARKNGCTKLWLETGEEWSAKKLYLSNGYEITGRQAKHIDGQDFLLFTKFL